MLQKQQIKQLLKQNIFIYISFKKHIRPLKILTSASAVSLEKKFIVIKYRASLIFPRFNKFSYDDIESIKPILKRKYILSEEQLMSITAGKTTPERKKEAKKVFLIKASCSWTLLTIATFVSVLTAFLIK